MAAIRSSRRGHLVDRSSCCPHRAADGNGSKFRKRSPAEAGYPPIPARPAWAGYLLLELEPEEELGDVLWFALDGTRFDVLSGFTRWPLFEHWKAHAAVCLRSTLWSKWQTSRKLRRWKRTVVAHSVVTHATYRKSLHFAGVHPRKAPCAVARRVLAARIGLESQVSVLPQSIDLPTVAIGIASHALSGATQPDERRAPDPAQPNLQQRACQPVARRPSVTTRECTSRCR